MVAASPPVNGPEIFKPANIVASLGKNLVGEDVGMKDIQFGPEALVALATLLVPDTVELSFCSQLYVNASPSASVADPVNAKGVLMGMVKLETAATTGVALFPTKLVVIGQVFPARLV